MDGKNGNYSFDAPDKLSSRLIDLLSFRRKQRGKRFATAE
jgi:hypothetical protein